MSTPTRRTTLLTRVVTAALVRPGRVAVVWAVWLIFAGFGLANLEIDTSTASFLDRSDPAWQTYQQSIARFGGDEFIVVALAGPAPFDRAILRELKDLSSAFRSIDGVRRVDSLATVNLLRGGGGETVRLDPLLASELPEQGAEWDQLLQDVRNDAVAPGGLVSADERIFALNVLLDEDVDADRAQTVADIRSLLRGRDALVSGVPVFRTAVNERTRSEVFLFTPITLLVIAVGLLVLFRGLVPTLAPIFVGAIGSATALGSMGALGVTLSLSTMILPSVLLALGCAYAMHVLTAALATDDEGLEAAMLSVARPVALSGLTTVIGFLAMATVPIDAIRELATFGAIGVFTVTAAALSLLPAVLSRLPMPTGGLAIDAWIRGPLRERLVAFLVQRRGLVCWAWVALFVIAGVGIMRLSISTDIILWFDRDTAIRSDYEEIRAQFSGITPVNIIVESESDEPVTDPTVLAAIGALETDLEALPLVGKAISIAGPLAQLHAIMLGPSEREVPDDRDTVEQYLLFLEGASYVRDVLSADHRTANILLRVDDNSSDEIVALESWVADWWDRSGPPRYSVKTTGIMYEFGRAEEQIAYGQIRGLALAFGAVAIILLALLRNVRMALIALLPNAIPLGIAFGLMGLLRVPLDAATVCLGSLAFGIAVDDTIHVLTRYQEERDRGRQPREALERGLQRALPALIYTTVTIGAGFLILGVSEFTLIRNLGLVTSGLVVLCLLADTTLLPALLLGGRSQARENRHSSS